MRKKSLILLAILVLATLNFITITPTESIKTNNLTTGTQFTTKGIITPNNIETQAYMSPYQVKILFDGYHQVYWSSGKFTEFINDIADRFGANVTIGNTMFNATPLGDFDLIIIPEFDTNLTSEEILALTQYLESGGAIFFMGDRSPYFDHPDQLNATTSNYGISWYSDQVYDNTTYDFRNYYPLVHVWSNNTVAQFLSNNSNFVVRFRGSPLIIGSNTTNYTIYVIGVGDNDTYTDTGRFYDGDIVFFAAVDLTFGGRFFASGSTEMFRTDNFYNYLNYKFDNKEFALRIIHWLLAEGLEISNLEYPTWTMKASDTALINVTIVNNADVNATNVRVSIEVNGTISVLNASQEYLIGTMKPGEVKKISWSIEATGTSDAIVTIKVWSDNVKGFSRAVHITTKGFAVDAYFEPKYVIFGSNSTLIISVTNPAGSGLNATNVNVSITLHNVLSTSNATSYHFDNVTENQTIVLRLIIQTTGPAVPAFATVDVVSDNFGSATATAYIYVFSGRIAVFYETYVGYFKHYRYVHFLNNVSYFRPLFVLDEPLTSELLNLTDLVILPDVDSPVPNDEATLLANYISNGGKLLMMGNWYAYFDPEYVNNITKPFGITWYDAESLDPNDNFGRDYQPVLYNFADNPYSRFLTKGVDSLVFQGATSFNVTPVSGVEFIPIVLGNNDGVNQTYLVNATGHPMGINGSDLVIFALVNVNGSGWIALSGSSYAFRSDGSYIDHYIQNKVFIWNLLRFFFTTEFVYDTTPPTVAITSPTDNSFVDSRTFTVNWTASDNVALDRFDIYVDGSFYKTVSGSERSVQITVTSEGPHEIKVEAYDHLDYTATSVITVIVDSQAPSLTVTSPSQGAWYTVSTITVEWTLSDTYPEGLKDVKIYLDGQLIDTVSPNVTTYTLTNLADGEHNLTIVAEDTFRSTKQTILFKVDTTKPELTDISIENETEITGLTLDLQFNISDNLCLDKVEVKVNGSTVFTQNLEGQTAYSGTVPLEFDQKGTYVIKVVIYDCAGNVAEYTYVITVKGAAGPPTTWILAILAIIIIVGVIGFLMYRRRG